MSGHQPGDDVPPPSPETNDGFPGVVLSFGANDLAMHRLMSDAGLYSRPTAKGRALVFVVIDDDIRPGHSANEPTTSPASASSFGSTVTSSRRWNRTRRNRSEPNDLKVQPVPGCPDHTHHEGS
jgi:hypothetical protein